MLPATFLCTGIRIANGDTCESAPSATVCGDYRAVRLAQLTPPRNHRRSVNAAARPLASRCFGRDRACPPVARTGTAASVGSVNRNGIDAGTRQVSTGLAWAFLRYSARG